MPYIISLAILAQVQTSHCAPLPKDTQPVFFRLLMVPVRIASDASSFFLNTPISAGDVLTSWLRPGDLILRTVTLWIDVSRNIILAGLRPALNYIPGNYDPTRCDRTGVFSRATFLFISDQ